MLRIRNFYLLIKVIFCLITIHSIILSLSYLQAKTKAAQDQLKNYLRDKERRQLIVTRAQLPHDHPSLHLNSDFVFFLDDVYYKRNSAVLLVDKKKLVLFLLTKNHELQINNLNFDITIKYQSFINTKLRQKASFKKIYDDGKNQNWKIIIDVSFKELLAYLKYDEINYSYLRSSFRLTSLDPTPSENALIREYEYKNDNPDDVTPMICVEPAKFSLTEIDSFNWWIKVLKIIGYQKVALYHYTVQDLKFLRKIRAI